MVALLGGGDNAYKMYGVRTDSWGSVANDVGSGSTFTINSNIEVEYRIRIAKGYTCNSLMFKPMLHEGTEEKPFEPYGVMPSLEYPSEIECVGDNVNCLDFQNYQKFTATAAYYAIRADTFDLKANETYTYDYEASGDFSKNNNIKLWFRDSNNAVFKEVLAKNTFTLSNEELNKLSYIQACIQVIAAGTTYEGYIYPKIERGSKETAYSKYGQGSVEISTSNKNICQSQSNEWELGMYDTTGQKVNHSLRARCKDLTPVATNTEIYFNTFNDEYSFIVRTYDENENFIGSVGRKMNEAKLVLDSNVKYISNTIAAINETAGSEEGQAILGKIKSGKIKPFICLSSEADKTFVEHRGETHIMLIQQKMFSNDTFEEKLDGWYEKHTYKMISLTGDENFSDIYTTNAPNPHQTWALATPNVVSTWSNMYGITCTHLTRILGNDAMNKNKIGICSDNNNLLFCVPFLTAEEFKNWLKEQYNVGTPLRVVCRLKNTEYIKCTDEQSKILDKIDTYRDGTIITTDNDLCKISLRYKQDLESRVSEIEKQMVGGN